MNRTTKLIIAAIVFIIFGAISLYADWFGGSARRAELKLQKAVEAELLANDIQEVSVEMDGQLARVVGTARSKSQRSKIIDIVKSARWSGGLITGGVTVVKADGLRVVELPNAPDTPFVWNAERSEEGGPVLLSGAVPDEPTRDQLLAHAKSLFPAGVIDRMTITPNVPAGDWSGAAKRSLDTLAQLQTGRATGDSNVFNVTGKAASREIANVAEDGLRAMPDGFRGEPNIVAPEPAKLQSPYIWNANMDDADKPVILEGFVPSREMQLRIVEHAESVFSNRVIDRMVVANGVPDGNWEETVRASLTTLASLNTGRASAEDFNFRVTGVAPTEATADNGRALMRTLAPGFVSEVDIDVAPPARVDVADQCQALFNDALRGNTINFQNAKAELREDSHELLDQLVVIAKRCEGFTITVAGHTDSVGSASLNQRLSEARAQAVVNYLLAGGVSAGELSAVGYGEERPVADNGTSEGRAQNRRIEFTIAQ